MEHTTLANKVKLIEQRLTVLEGGTYAHAWKPSKLMSIPSVWEKTQGVLSTKRAASLTRKVKEGRKRWSAISS